MLSYITGANGFIGSHLIPHLKGEIVPIPHEQIQSFHLEPFQYFYFLSTYGNMYTQQDDEKIFRANIADVIAIFSQIKDKHFKSFVYLSTSSVKLRTQTMYSRAKKAVEEILLSEMEKHDIPVCIIRPYSVIGVGEQKEHLIPTLLRSCMAGEKVNFVKHPVHDYIDIDDVVSCILSLSQHGARGIYEAGTGIRTTNQEVLEIVEKVTGKKANVNYVDSMRPYDTEDWVSTNFRSRSYGWLPLKSLEQSVKEMYESVK